MVEKRSLSGKSVTLGDVKAVEAGSGVKAVEAQSPEKKRRKKIDKDQKDYDKILKKMNQDFP